MKFNGDWFYDEFKDALRTLGLNWGEKHLVTIEVKGGAITFSGNGRSITIEVCPGEKAPS